MNVQKKAEELAEALVESAQYKRLQKARETVENHEAAKIMLRDFLSKQNELQKQQAEGKELTDEQKKELEKLYEIIQINPYLRELLEAEMEFGRLMMDVQNTLGNALGLQTEEPPEDDGLSEQEEQRSSITGVEKKLWTPGD